VTRRTTTVGGSDFTTVIKALSYPSAQSSKISITKHHDSAVGSGGPPLLESVDEFEGDWK
jgi:hypothetical protein